jgi:hypothetical protein
MSVGIYASPAVRGGVLRRPGIQVWHYLAPTGAGVLVWHSSHPYRGPEFWFDPSSGVPLALAAPLASDPVDSPDDPSTSVN